MYEAEGLLCVAQLMNNAASNVGSRDESIPIIAPFYLGTAVHVHVVTTCTHVHMYMHSPVGGCD